MPSISNETNKTIISLKNIGLRYNKGPEVLKDINLEIKAGDFYFLTGASGAGKTSLLKLLHLAHRPSRGKLKIFGHDIDYIHRMDISLPSPEGWIRMLPTGIC